MPSTQTDRLQGLTTSVAVKAPVLCASTGNLTLSSTQVIDGVVTSTGDRVLVKNQTDATENGIYIVDTSTWSRAKDADGARDLVIGTMVYVSTGSTDNTNYQRFFSFGSTSSTSNTITPGTDTMTIGAVTVLAVPSTITVTGFAETLLDDSTAATMRATLAIEGSTQTFSAQVTFTNPPFLDRNITAQAASYLRIFRQSTEQARLGLDANDAFTIMKGAADTPGWSFGSTGSLSAATSTGLALTAGQINAAGFAVEGALLDSATQAEQETGTSTSVGAIVTPGVQHFHPTAAKTWGYVTYSAGAPTLQASHNVASVTDDALGKLTINLTTGFSSTNYSVAVTCDSSAIGYTANIASTLRSSTSFQIIIANASEAAADPIAVSFVAFGDL